jgi:hypothetical protein
VHTLINFPFSHFHLSGGCSCLEELCSLSLAMLWISFVLSVRLVGWMRLLILNVLFVAVWCIVSVVVEVGGIMASKVPSMISHNVRHQSWSCLTWV